MSKNTNFSKKKVLSKKEITQINRALQIQLTKEAKETVQKANKLNQLFSDLKRYQQMQSQGTPDLSSIAHEFTKNIINEELANTLFQSSSNLAADPAQTAGAAFEKIFSNAINTISEQYDFGIQAIQSGKESAIVGMENIVDDVVQQVQENGIQMIEQQAAANNATETSGTKLTVGVARQGKNDVVVQITGKLNPELEGDLKILRDILSDATFSIKSYKDMTGIKVGETGMQKAIMGALIGLNYTFAEAQSIYQRGFVQMKNDDAVSKLFYNLQLAYETRGMGLLDSAGVRVSTAKYLVQNSYSLNGDIHIYSTADMVLKKLNTSKDLWTLKSGMRRTKTYSYATGRN